MKYPFTVVYTKENTDYFWLARSSSLDGCIGTGRTPEEAISELEENESTWLEAAMEFGDEIPRVPVEEEKTFSGKLSLRISPAVHKKASVLASRENISLNQFINDAIVNYSAELETGAYISERVASIAQNIGMRSLAGRTESSPDKKIIQFPLNADSTLRYREG